MAGRGLGLGLLSSATGKYFIIKNKASGTVLNVKEGLTDPGTSIVMWKEHKGENQVWYAEPLTGTIRNRQSNLCIDLDASGNLIINTYNKDNPNQQWRWNKERSTLENSVNPVKVFDVAGGNKASGTEVAAYEYHGAANQQWKLESMPIQYFVVRSELSGKVMDISGGKANTGAKVILWEQKAKASDNQLWYEDQFGNIRSKLSDKLCFDGSAGGVIVTGEFKVGKRRSFWVKSGNKIVNKENLNEVIGVRDNMTVDGAELVVSNYRSEKGQHWFFDSV